MRSMNEWTETKNQLVHEIVGLGFPEQLGEEAAKNLGSPKAMRRMISYLRQVRPKKVELVVDEMLAICSEIENWRDKKESQEANATISTFLRYGLTDED